MAESEEELKSLLMKVKEKSWLKAQHSENEDHGISGLQVLIKQLTGADQLAEKC